MLSNPIILRIIHGESGDRWNFSTSVQLDISQVSAMISHILQAM